MHKADKIISLWTQIGENPTFKRENWDKIERPKQGYEQEHSLYLEQSE